MSFRNGMAFVFLIWYLNGSLEGGEKKSMQEKKRWPYNLKITWIEFVDLGRFINRNDLMLESVRVLIRILFVIN
jgi:hypothetical protein